MSTSGSLVSTSGSLMSTSGSLMSGALKSGSFGAENEGTEGVGDQHPGPAWEALMLHDLPKLVPVDGPEGSSNQQNP